MVTSPRASVKALYPLTLEHRDGAEHRRDIVRAIQILFRRAKKHPEEVSEATAAYTVDDDDLVVLCDATGGAFTVTLLTAAGREGQRLIVKKTDAGVNVITIDGAGAETIDGAAAVTLTVQYSTKELVSDGTNWHLVSVI